jgi:hypothetical protein
MNKIEEEKLKNTIPPEKYTGHKSYPYSIRYCPGYDGYIPKNLDHEICKHCGSISYYH